MPGGVDVERTVVHRAGHVPAQRQIAHVAGRDQHALAAGQALADAQVVEPLDLLRHAAHRLHVSMLVDGPGYGQALIERVVGQRREQRQEFRQRRAVALHAPVGLLEGNGGAHGDGAAETEHTIEEAGQDHGALVVNGSRQLGLAVDADDAVASREHPGRDAVGLTELMVAHANDGQPVHLADGRPGSVDHDGAVGHPLANPGFQQVRPPDALVDRGPHVRLGHQVLAPPPRPVLRFAHDVADVPEARGKLGAVAGQAHALFHDAGHGRAVEVAQVLIGAAGRDELRVARGVVGVQVDLRLEFRQNLEKLPEIRVQFVEQRVHVRRPDQRDFEVQRDRFRLQPRRQRQAKVVGHALDAYPLVAQRALQGRVGGARLQQIVRGQHQVAAVGPVQRAGLNQREVRDADAQFRAGLHPSKEVGVRRVGVANQRRAGFRPVRDQHVDAVRQVGIRRRTRPLRGQRGGVGLQEVLVVLRHVRFHRVQVGRHVRQRGVLLAQVVQQGFRHAARHVGVQIVERGARRPLAPAQPPQQARQPVLQFPARRPDALALGLGRVARRLGRRRPAVIQRRHTETDRRLRQSKAGRGRALFEVAKRLAALGLHGLRQRVPLTLVLLGVERALQLVAQRLHDILQPGAVGRRLAGRQPQRTRPAAVGEIVDVAPIVRGRTTRGLGLQLCHDHRGPARAGRARRVDIEPAATNVHAELKGAFGAFLADQGGGRTKVGRACKRQVGRVAGPAHLGGRQPPRAGGFSSIRHARIGHAPAPRAASARSLAAGALPASG